MFRCLNPAHSLLVANDVVYTSLPTVLDVVVGARSGMRNTHMFFRYLLLLASAVLLRRSFACRFAASSKCGASSCETILTILAFLAFLHQLTKPALPFLAMGFVVPRPLQQTEIRRK